MNNQDHPTTWAQTRNHSVMGLDVQDEDLSEFLNFNEFSTYNALESGDTAATQPFGDDLALPGDIGNEVDDALPYFDEHSRSITAAQTSQAFEASPPRQDHRAIATSSHYGPRDFQRATNDVFNNPMRGSLPTPNSSEMYGKSAEQFYRHQQQLAQQTKHRQHVPQYSNGGGVDLNTFTPYESPGLEGCQSAVSYVPEYTVPGSYALSPLSSPAINPQVNQAHALRSHPRTAESSVAQSPQTERGDTEAGASIGQEERPRKTRKKTAPTTRAVASSGRRGKASTAHGNRRDSLNLRIATRSQSHSGDMKSQTGKEAIELQEAASALATPTESMTSSTSPHPRSDAPMAPPPKPGPIPTTTSHSSNRHVPTPVQTSNPATPTSMMRTRPVGRPRDGLESDSPRDHQSPGTNALESGMEYLRLPEAATPATDPNKGAVREDSRETPITQPKPAAGSGPASESPQAASTAASPAGPTGISKTDSRNGGSVKKRSSSSSNLISPALRPKVSPGMKPLLPEGSGMDSQTQAMLLASRSNYENIVSGHHLPGVSYDSDLRNTLTSKRTSHKLAEQGRRNRINDALKEMQTLLPPKFAALAQEDEGNGSGSSAQNKAKGSSGAGQSGNSKAATVENAIDYIKHLQREVEQKDGMIRALGGGDKQSSE